MNKSEVCNDTDLFYNAKSGNPAPICHHLLYELSLIHFEVAFKALTAKAEE